MTPIQPSDQHPPSCRNCRHATWPSNVLERLVHLNAGGRDAPIFGSCRAPVGAPTSADFVGALPESQAGRYGLRWDHVHGDCPAYVRQV